MKKSLSKLLILLLSGILVLSITSCANKNTSENGDSNIQSDIEGGQNVDIEQMAVSFVDELINGNYQDAYDNYDFTEKMKKGVNPQILESSFKQLIEACGSFIKRVKTTKSKHESYDIISVVCQFENAHININVVFDKEKKIAGFNFSEAEEAGDSASNKPDNIEEYEVMVGEGEWELPATLTLPKGNGPFSTVVLVHGSGPNDRDETIGPNKPFRDIAWGLASNGIAVLRYEKRTKQYAEKMISNRQEITVKEEAIDDAINAVTLLKSNERINSNKVFVLGHSLGGYLVPRIYAEDKNIAGAVILAGSTRPLEDLIVEQIEYLSFLDGEITEDEQAQIDAVNKAAIKIKSSDLSYETDPNELLGIYPKYWLDLREYNPLELIKEINEPVLVLQGERDYQVTMIDFNNWKVALKDNRSAVFKSYTKLNHLFIEGEGEPNPQEYNLKGNVSKEVIDDISKWINEN